MKIKPARRVHDTTAERLALKRFLDHKKTIIMNSCFLKHINIGNVKVNIRLHARIVDNVHEAK